MKLQKRILLFPVTWLGFGIGEVYALRRLFGSVADIAPTTPNDKPIGGSLLPVLFFNVATILVVIGISLYSLGYWRVDLSDRKTRMDLVALAVLVSSGFLLWEVPVALFPWLATLVYFLATNVE